MQKPSLELLGDFLSIVWEDGFSAVLPVPFLRQHSPSAETAGETDIFGTTHGGDAPDARYDSVKLQGWNTVGNYAFQFRFSDGHNTGIYTYDYLKKLAKASNTGE